MSVLPFTCGLTLKKPGANVSLKPVITPSTPANTKPHTAIFCSFTIFSSAGPPRRDLQLTSVLNFKCRLYQIFGVCSDHNFELSRLDRKAHLTIPESEM